MAWKTSLLIFCQPVYETDWLQVYAQLFAFASSFFSFLKSQKLRRNFQAWRAVGSNDLLTIPNILSLRPEPEDFSRPPAKTHEVLSASLKQHTIAHYAYEDEVFDFLRENRRPLGIDRVFRFKNLSMDGELLLQDGATIPFEIKFRMNWLKACQANWQFARFLKLTGRTSCNIGIVFFEEFSGDWDITAKSRSVPNGWIRWYKEHYQLQGLDFHLVRLRNGVLEAYADVISL